MRGNTLRARGTVLPLLLFGSALATDGCRGKETAGGGERRPGLVYRCEGFAGPIEKQMEIQRGRTLPLKAQLLDPAGKPVVQGLDPAPEIRLIKIDGGSEVEQSEVATAGDFGKARRFVFRESNWKFDLATADFPELGTYRAEVVSGDESRYAVEPRCEVTFVLR